jgi:hypothetical protein
MITGLNIDIDFQGKTYHVQTEDKGLQNPMILSILFHSGAILTTRKTSYADILKAENLPVLLKELMNDQHKKMIQDLLAGKFTQPGTAAGSKPDAVRPPEPGRTPEDRPAAKPGGRQSLDDMILDYLATREEHKKS